MSTISFNGRLMLGDIEVATPPNGFDFGRLSGDFTISLETSAFVNSALGLGDNLQISDHGNAELYAAVDGEWESVWSCV